MLVATIHPFDRFKNCQCLTYLSPSYTNMSSSFQISCCKSFSKKKSAFLWHSNKPINGKMHYIAKGDSRRRCKVFQSKAVYICSKCKQHLHEKCFKTFHGQWKWQNAYFLSFYIDKILLFMLFLHFYENSILLKKIIFG